MKKVKRRRSGEGEEQVEQKLKELHLKYTTRIRGTLVTSKQQLRLVVTCNRNRLPSIFPSDS